MAVLAAECFTPAERLRANHAVHECACDQKLALWLKNVSRVRDEREAKLLADFAEGLAKGEALVKEAAQQPTPTAYATPAQCDEVFALASLSCFTKGEKTHTLNLLPTLTQAGAVKVIGSLYAAAWRRGKLALLPESGGSSFKPFTA